MPRKTARRKMNRSSRRTNKHRKGKGLRKHKRQTKRTYRRRARRVHRGGSAAFAGKVWNPVTGGNYYALNKTGGPDTPMNSPFYNMAGKASVNDLAKAQNSKGVQKGGYQYTRKHRRSNKSKQKGGNPLKNLYRNVVYKGEQFVRGVQGKTQPVNPSVSVQPIDTGSTASTKGVIMPQDVPNAVKQADSQVAKFK